MTLYEALSARFDAERGRWHLPHDTADPREEPIPEELLRSVDLTGYESRQHERTFTIATSIVMLATLLLGGVSALSSDWVSMWTLFGAALLCTPIQTVNRRYGQYAAGTLLSLLILVVVTANLIDGNGLHDIAILTYPIFLIFGGLILGKRALWPLGLGCCLSIALVVGLEVTGRLESPHPVTAEDPVIFLVLLTATAVVVWVSMDNIEKNIDRIRRSEAMVRLAYERTLEAWARALEYRDRDTEGHSRRVTELSVRLARELDLSEAEVTRIRWGALLHDIGKLAIPDRILMKAGPLTDSEMALMRRHPVYAKEMLSEIPFLRKVIDIPYYHHERWDGKGYPEGLRGTEIPLAARLFAVVDQWEALSSDRPYRRAWPEEKIVAHLRQGAGTYFDPRIVRVFLERVCRGLDLPEHGVDRSAASLG